MKKLAAAMAMLAMVVGACGTGLDQPAGENSLDAGVTPTSQPAEVAPTTEGLQPAEVEDVDQQPSDRSAPARELSSQTEAAARDLSGRLGMGDADVTVFSVENVTWRDGSLGCPVEGRAYTQALVPDGYRIVFTANGELHHYHGAGSGAPVYCENPQEPYRDGGGDTPSNPDA